MRALLILVSGALDPLLQSPLSSSGNVHVICTPTGLRTLKRYPIHTGATHILVAPFQKCHIDPSPQVLYQMQSLNALIH